MLGHDRIRSTSATMSSRRESGRGVLAHVPHWTDVEPVMAQAGILAGPRFVCHDDDVVLLDSLLETLSARGFDGRMGVEIAQRASEGDECTLVARCFAWLHGWLAT